MEVPANLEGNNSVEINPPNTVHALLQRACYDCHSNSVIYPWYAHIAPLSWYIKRHVKEGRKRLNFSQWKTYDPSQQQKLLEKIPKAIRIRMPLPDYLWLHPEAKLSNEDKKLLRNWAKKQQLQGE